MPGAGSNTVTVGTTTLRLSRMQFLLHGTTMVLSACVQSSEPAAVPLEGASSVFILFNRSKGAD